MVITAYRAAFKHLNVTVEDIVAEGDAIEPAFPHAECTKAYSWDYRPRASP